MVVIIIGKTENPSNSNCCLIPTHKTDKKKKKQNRIQTRNLISSKKKLFKLHQMPGVIIAFIDQLAKADEIGEMILCRYVDRNPV